MFDLKFDSSIEEISPVLSQNNWLETAETITTTETPGAGNMNVVLRIKTNLRTFILKQSKDFVQKYPQIPAPINRIAVEHQFYILTANVLPSKMPKLLGFDSKNHLLMLEDLGEGSDFTTIYAQNQPINQADVFEAIDTLSLLHNTVFDQKTRVAFPDNLTLRKLNYEHLFNYPFMLDNGFDLDSIQTGLQAVAMVYKTNEMPKNKLKTLGERYLSQGDTLLHGDYYPGSWLKTKNGFKLIDPEFCFFGPGEYDLGVMIAHLKMAKTADDLIKQTIARYQQGIGFDSHLMYQFVGMELFRRIIGLAQLPLTLTLSEKETLLEEALAMLL
jgi:5-methylthioribose kinase